MAKTLEELREHTLEYLRVCNESERDDRHVESHVLVTHTVASEDTSITLYSTLADGSNTPVDEGNLDV